MDEVKGLIPILVATVIVIAVIKLIKYLEE